MIILISIQIIIGFLVWKSIRKLYEYDDYREEHRLKFPIIVHIVFAILTLLPIIGVVLHLLCIIALIMNILEEDYYYKHSKLGLKIKNFLFKQI